ncbi:MAG TPA: hypothetical protein VLT59_06740, partial [Steroidobacteraceae bacterium]|nr:hypothetical protein [Steroidobacteraceae bacterium]
MIGTLAPAWDISSTGLRSEGSLCNLQPPASSLQPPGSRIEARSASILLLRLKLYDQLDLIRDEAV